MTTDIPNHVALIPDGNRRWAKERGKNTYEGHKKGFDQLIKIAKKARNLGIKIFTVWAFSTENWKRTKEEIAYLMKLYEVMLDRYLSEAMKDKIRIIHLGRKNKINENLKNMIINAENKTKAFTNYYLCIGLDYGGRDEIERAVAKGKNNFVKFLDTKDLPFPDPDLVIRTGGEQRISGFMLWQSQYAELVFEKKYLPDYTDLDFEKTVNEFCKEQRRFGK